MTDVRQRPNAPARAVTEVGPGDYVKIGRRWEPIRSNSAHGLRHAREWTVTTDSGSFDMWGINAYAKAEDMESHG